MKKGRLCYRVSIVVGLVAVFLSFFALVGGAGEQWWPVKVTSIYRDGTRNMEYFVPPVEAKKRWYIGAAIPHLKDPIWVGIDYGVMSEAERLGIKADLLAAGGYTELARQINQIENFIEKGVDALIVGVVSYESLDATLEMAERRGVRVIACFNDTKTNNISAKSLLNYFEMGKAAGMYVSEKLKGGGKVVFLPGPAGPAWPRRTLEGFKAAIKDNPGIEILAVRYGETSKDVQIKLVEDVLHTFPEIDYVVGNALAISVGARIAEEMGRKVNFVGTYLNPEMVPQIEKGKIAGAPTDIAAIQAKIAVDLAVKILNGEPNVPFHVIPEVQFITPENIKKVSLYGNHWPPKGWRPKFHVE